MKLYKKGAKMKPQSKDEQALQERSYAGPKTRHMERKKKTEGHGLALYPYIP